MGEATKAKRKKSLLLSGVATVGAACGLFSLPAAAQAQEQSAKSGSFNIAAQPLSDALLRFGEQAGLQFSFDTNLLQGRAAPALNGSYSVEAGLSILLADSGFTYRFTSATTVSIIPVSTTGADGERVLGAVRVEGAQTTAGVNGINGSRDVTATEGTGSYTSGALTVASKSPLSIKDTPQSVSVLTAQRIEDQNLTDLKSALNQMTGVTLVNNGNDEYRFYSRGFEITRFQIDGGSPLSSAQLIGAHTFKPNFDLAIYDHVEVLRGVDGQFNSYGDPGGVINLSRKRPLDHTQIAIDGHIGSWSNYRTVLDASSPLGLDEKLRGRAVMAYQNQDFFYDKAKSERAVFYGIIEADITPNTVAAIGGDFTKIDSLPFAAGLPRYEDGADLALPRSTCLCFDWNRSDLRTRNLFFQLDHQLGDDWRAKLNLVRTRQDMEQKFAAVQGPVNPESGTGFLAGFYNVFKGKQTLADVTVSGEPSIFGNVQSFVVGANWRRYNNSGNKVYDGLYSFSNAPIIDVVRFNDDDFPEPETPTLVQAFNPLDVQDQWSVFATARLTPWEPLHVTIGARYSGFRYAYRQIFYCTEVYPGCANVGDVFSDSSLESKETNITWPPMIAISYDVGKTLTAYGSYTDIYESNTGLLDKSRKQIAPTTGSNIEAGIKFQSRDGRINASVAAYRIEQKNFPLFVAFVPTGNPNTGCCYSNDNNRVNFSRGIDVEISGEIVRNVNLSAGYTHNYNEIRGSDAEIEEGFAYSSFTPRHLFKLWADVKLDGPGLLKNSDFGIGVNAQSKIHVRGFACVEFIRDPNGSLVCSGDGFREFKYTQGGYAILSVKMGFALAPQWHASLKIDNITDKKYYKTMGTSTSDNWYGEPRSVTLGIRGKF